MYYPSSENKGADQLICVFVFAYADCWFSHEAAQVSRETTPSYLHFRYLSKNIANICIFPRISIGRGEGHQRVSRQDRYRAQGHRGRANLRTVVIHICYSYL